MGPDPINLIKGKHTSCATVEMRARYYMGGQKPVKKGQTGKKQSSTSSSHLWCFGLGVFFNAMSIKCTQSVDVPETKTEIYVFQPLLIWSD